MALCLSTAPLQAQDFSAAASSVEKDLAAELATLAEVRETIAAEKPTLSRETNEIAAEIREKRHAADLARQERDALLYDLQKLDKDVRALRDESGYIQSMLVEFQKEFGATVGPAEFSQLDLDGPPMEAVSTAIDQLIAAPGGKTFTGESLGTDGVAKTGTFITAGPLTWFVSEDQSLAGIVGESSELFPEAVSGTNKASTLTALATGELASPSFDPTGGTALALDNAKTSLVDHIKQGGFWIWPILFLAAIALIAAIVKWIQISRIREVRPATVQEVISAVNADETEEAQATVARIKHPSRALLAKGIESAGRPRELIEEALYEKFIAAQPSLNRGLALIAIASATAPLLGLLGTVTGMIHTFKLINIFGTGDAKSLASGISEALVTTEFGLAVAIPALILHAMLSRKVAAIRSSMEMTSLAFVNGLNK